MPSPSQTRDLRIKRLTVLARRLHESGVVYGLYDRVERASWQLWPTLGDKTRRSYVQSALRMALEGPHPAESTLPEAVELPQEDPQ